MGDTSPSLVLFLLLSFVNGCVLEIGRKLWAPENELVGVDTYSGLWGVKFASRIWMTCVGVSFLVLVAVGAATGVALASFGIGLFGYLVCLGMARKYRQSPNARTQKHMDTIAGLWVFLCYATAGFLPIIVKGFV